MSTHFYVQQSAVDKRQRKMLNFNLKLGSDLQRQKYHTESYSVLFSALKHFGAISLAFFICSSIFLIYSGKFKNAWKICICTDMLYTGKRERESLVMHSLFPCCF